MSRVVVVSGANGQLGSVVVQRFLDAGDLVVGLVRKSSSEISVEGYIEMDVNLLDETQCQEAIERIVAGNGRLDVAVLTAGGFAMGDLDSTGSIALENQYNLNFVTAYNIARPVLNHMIQQDKGRIFLIGSKAGLDVSKAKSTIAYALAKSLVFRLAEIFNGIAKGKNIVTSVVVPSVIDTPQNRMDMPDADFSGWVTTNQIADNIFYYCSDEADSLRFPVLHIYNRS